MISALSIPPNQSPADLTGSNTDSSDPSSLSDRASPILSPCPVNLAEKNLDVMKHFNGHAERRVALTNAASVRATASIGYIRGMSAVAK
jgi:hypothetical protein